MSEAVGIKKIVKRNRTSYVCFACRKRKTRCDRIKPCSRCRALGTECSYAIKELNEPNGEMLTDGLEEVSENAVGAFDVPKLMKLQEELQYWKSKAQTAGSNTNSNSNPPCYSSPYSESIGTSVSDYALGSGGEAGLGDGAVAGEDTGNNGLQVDSHIRLSIDDCESTFMLHESLRALHPPFSFLSLGFRDPHLVCLFASMYGFTFTNVINFLGRKEDITIFDVMNFAAKTMIDNEHPLPFYFEPALITHVQQGRNQKNVKHVPLVIFTKGERIEELSSDEFPPALQMMLSDVQKVLPSTQEALEYHLNHFFQKIYPLYPFLEVSSFLTSINKIIKYDNTNPEQKPVCTLNKSTLRRELENLALLMIILQMARDSISMSFDPKIIEVSKVLKILESDSQHDDFVSFCQRILNILNAGRLQSEEIFCCMLYHRLCCSFSPRECNVFFDQQPIIQLGKLVQIALVLGLHKDPSDYLMMANPAVYPKERINFRRKLWLGLCCVIFQEAIPLGFTGNVERYDDLFFKNFRTNLFSTAVTQALIPSNEFDYRFIDMLLKKYHIGLLMAKINKACTDVQPARLKDILFSVSKLESELLKFYSQKDNISSSTENINIPFENCSANVSEIMNCEIFAVKLVSRSFVLNVVWSFFLKVESKVRTEPLKYSQTHSKLFEMTILNCLEFSNFLFNILSKNIDTDSILPYRYSLNKHVQHAYLRVLLCLTSLLLKLSLLKRDLNNEINNRDSLAYSISEANCREKLQGVEEVYAITETIFLELVKIAGESRILKGSLFFNKITCLFAYLVQVIELGRLLEVSTRFWDYELQKRFIPEKVRESVLQKWSLDVKFADVIKSKFYSDSSLHLIERNTWRTILKRVRELKLPVSCAIPTTQKTEFPMQPQPTPEMPPDLNLDFANLFDIDTGFGLPSFSF